MKFKRVVGFRENRTISAAEVLKSPEQPHREVWDVHDPELFSLWLRNGPDFSHSQLRYAVVDLGIINPSLVTPEIREAAVAAATTIMEKEVYFWKKGGQGSNFGMKCTR